jgi:CDP-diacylglycerol---glycerol-3-phosphate 3-phosphatidyltransferase
MSLANIFTASRIVLAPFFLLLFFLPEWAGFSPQLSVIILIPLFTFMEFTDFLDGFFARKTKSVSDFGKLFDPFADVLANLTVLLCFMVAGYLPVLLFIVILYREMSIMFVRMLASRNGVAIGARKGGKTKTVMYIAAAGFSLAIETLVRFNISLPFSLEILKWVNLGLYGLAVVLAIVSFIDYLTHYSAILKTSKKTT